MPTGWPTPATTTRAIRDNHQRHRVTLDPHTADGVKVAREHLAHRARGRPAQDPPAAPMIVLETALPIKFAATIIEALGQAPERPAQFAGIENLPRRVQRLPDDAQQVKAYIERHCTAEE